MLLLKTAKENRIIHLSCFPKYSFTEFSNKAPDSGSIDLIENAAVVKMGFLCTAPGPKHFS